MFSKAWRDKFPWLLAALLCTIHLGFILSHAVNTPYWDEFEFLRPNAFSAGLSLEWLFAPHNEHVIVFTKFQNWIFFKLFHWNIVAQVAFNYAIYLGIVALTVHILMRFYDIRESSRAMFFSLFLFSTKLAENHSWAFQSQFHYVVLFTLAAIWMFFTATPPSFRRGCLGSLFLVAATFSFSAGLAAAVAVSAVFIASRAWNLLSHQRDWAARLPRLALETSPLVIVAAGALAWRHFYHSVSGHPTHSMPWTWTFWPFYLNLVSYAFGITGKSLLLALAYFVVSCALPLALLKGSGRDGHAWGRLALVLSLLALLATIAIGRAGFGLDASKSSRYGEFGIPFASLTLAGFWLLWSGNKSQGRRMKWVFVILFAGFLPHWGPTSYKTRENGRIEGLNCAVNYYRGHGDGNCPTLYPAPIPDLLETARRLDIPPYRGDSNHS